MDRSLESRREGWEVNGGRQHKSGMVLTSKQQITSPRELRELEKRSKAEQWRLQNEEET